MTEALEEKDASALTGKLLLAMPGIGDPRFFKAVIYVCAHDENGAMGLVVNNAMPELSFQNLMDQIGLSSDIEIDLEKLAMPIMNGGPVDTARGFLLHTPDFKREETIIVDDEVSISGTVEALRDSITGKGPEDSLFILGYAGWTAGQLEGELGQNAWLVAEATGELLFRTENDEKWDEAVKGLGFDPAMLSISAGSA